MRRVLAVALTAAFLVLVIVSAVTAITTELPRQSFMTGSEYTTGLYARYQVSGTIASNDGLLAVRIASVTGGPCLPVGGATTPAYSPDAMAFGFVRDFRVAPISIWELSPDADSIYVPLGVSVGSDWSVLMSSPRGDPRSTIAERYNVGSVLENSARPGVYYTGWGVVYDSPLLRDMYAASHTMYEADGVRIWYGA